MRRLFALALTLGGASGFAQLAHIKWTMALPVGAHDVKLAAMPDGKFAVTVPQISGSEAKVDLRLISASGVLEWTRNTPFVSADLLLYSNGDIGIVGANDIGLMQAQRIRPNGDLRWWAMHPFYATAPDQTVSAKLGPSEWLYLGGKATTNGVVRGDILAIDQNGTPRWTARPDGELGIEPRIAAIGSNSDVVFISNQVNSGVSTVFPVRMRDTSQYQRLEDIPFASLVWLPGPTGFYFRAGTRNGLTGYVEKVGLAMNLSWAFPTLKPVTDLKVDPWGNLVPLLENGNLLRIRTDGTLKTSTSMPYGADFRGAISFGLDKYGRHTVLANTSSASKLFFGDAWTPARWSIPLAGPGRALVVSRATGDSLSLVTEPLTGRLVLQCVEQVPETFVDSAKVLRSLLVAGNVLTNDRYVGTGWAEIVQGPANGTFTLAPNGAYTYQAFPRFAGRDLFRYRIVKPGLDSVFGDLRIEVVP